MARQTLDPKIKQLVIRFSHLANQKWPIEKVIVFGSQAKGNTHEWSDIDVCLVSTKFGKDFFAEKSNLRRLTDQVSTKIEPTPLHPSMLANKYNTLAHEIRTHGIIIKI